MDVRWDPRLGPDREHSGVLHVGKDAIRGLTSGRQLRIVKDGSHWTLREHDDAGRLSGTRGSQRWIQAVVNNHPERLDDPIRAATGASGVTWVSPLRDDEFAEYRDRAAVDLLGVELDRRPLEEFWPRFGPQWDALATLDDGGVVLLEAKAHIAELFSNGCGAVSGRSRELIEASLAEAQRYVTADSATPWTGPLYQYVNRLAHLYLLRVENDIPAWLVNCYFVGDTDMGGPMTAEEWRAALTVVKRVLGLRSHPLSRYMVDVFVPVTDL